MIKGKIKKVVLTVFLVMSLTTQVSFAHGGRTDGSGGHHDNKNKSGLGSYHYHCGGNPAHLHNNGACPYSSNASSSSTSSNNNSAATNEVAQNINKDKENGYNVGYQSALNGETFDNKNNSSYSSEYKDGYSSGYEKGKSELETKNKNAYDEGFKIGSKNEKESNTYSGPTKDSYSKGYKEGIKKYIEENKVTYIKFAEEDAANFKMRDLEGNILNELKEEYTKKFNSKISELKKDSYDKGYVQALKNEELDHSNFKTSEQINSFKEGYEKGKSDLDKENNRAYEIGLKGEEYSVPENLSVVEEVLLASYKKGTDEKSNIDKSNGGKVVVGSAVVLIGGGIAASRRKKLFKRRNDNQ